MDNQVQKGLDIVPSCIMDVVMDINAHESRVFNVGVPLLVRNMATSFLVPESLAMSEVYHVNE